MTFFAFCPLSPYGPLWAFLLRYVRIIPMIYQEKCAVLENVKIAPDYYRLTVSSKNIHRDAKPGQFVQIQICNSSVEAGRDLPLLRRPFSIHKINNDGFTIIYHIVGKGTKILSGTQKGAELDIIGPLGNGFDIDKNKTAILIAGGCGSAPLYCLEEELKKKGITSHFFMGATTKDLLLCGQDFAKIGTKLYISTDDGSCGEKCTVSALYSSYIEALDPGKCVIYTCGPKAMMKAVSEIAAEKGVPCQVSLEEYMACGIGACLGCVVETVSGNRRVCKDGPVFDAKEIIWQ